MRSMKGIVWLLHQVSRCCLCDDCCSDLPSNAGQIPTLSMEAQSQCPVDDQQMRTHEINDERESVLPDTTSSSRTMLEDGIVMGAFPGTLSSNVMSSAEGESSIFAAYSADQTPGQSGLVSGSEDEVWRCAICRTTNHKSNKQCGGNCQIANSLHGFQDEDPESLIERLSKQKLAIEQAMEAAQRILVAKRASEVAERKQQQHPILAKELLMSVNLQEIAQSGDARLLLELDALGLLDSIPDVNKLYSFTPPGYATKVDATTFAMRSLLTLLCRI